MEPIEVECPNCGAALPGRDPAAGWTCRYCGTSFRVDRVRRAKTVAGVRLSPEQIEAIARSIGRAAASPEPAAPPPASSRRPSKTGGAGQAVVGVVLFLIPFVGVGSAYLYDEWKARSSTNPGSMSAATPGSPDRAGSESMWDDTGEPPLIVRDGGRTLAIGRVRDLGRDDGPYVDAFDLADGRRAYRLGPFGGSGAARGSVEVALAGSALLVTTTTPSLEVFGATDGERRSSTPLTDRVDQLCPLEDGRVYLRQVDERAFFVQPDTAELEPAKKRPRACRSTPFHRTGPTRDHKIRGAFVARRRLPKRPRIPGAATLERFDEEDRVVLVGVRDPGTPMPKAAAFDAKGAPLWQVEVADVPQASYRAGADLFAAVDEGRLYVLFGTGADGWRMTAIGTADGARLWSADLAPLFSVDRIGFLQPAGDRLLVGRGSGVEVWDARKGTRAYVIGSLTYR